MIVIGHDNNIPTMQFFAGFSRNTQSKSFMLSLTECVFVIVGCSCPIWLNRMLFSINGVRNIFCRVSVDCIFFSELGCCQNIAVELCRTLGNSACMIALSCRRHAFLYGHINGCFCINKNSGNK